MKRPKGSRPTKGAFAVITTAEGARHRVMETSAVRPQRLESTTSDTKVGKSRFA